MSVLTPRQAAEGYLDAFGAHDHQRARTYLAPDLTFVGPTATFDNADDYVAATKQLDGICQSIEKHKVIVEGSDVMILYTMETGTPFGGNRIAQWFHVEEGKITGIEEYFDTRPLAELFQS